MGFPVVPKSVTLNDLEQRNGRVIRVISPKSVAYGVCCLKVVEYILTHSASEMLPKVATRKLSVCLSVCQSVCLANECILT